MGNEVKVVIAAVGNIKHRHSNTIITGETRKKELADAMNYLGCNDFEVIYDDKDSLIDTIPSKKLIAILEVFIYDFDPTMVFIPLPRYHQDYQALNKVCISALRPPFKSQY